MDNTLRKKCCGHKERAAEEDYELERKDRCSGGGCGHRYKSQPTLAKERDE